MTTENTDNRLDGPNYDGSYLTVLEQARGIAAAGDGMLGCEQIFHALLMCCPEVFTRLLGVECVLPVVESKTGGIGDVRLGAQASRVLSPYGGYMGEVRATLSDDMPVNAMQMAAALLWEPLGPVRNFLMINGVVPGKGLQRRLLGELQIAEVDYKMALQRERRTEMLRKLRIVHERLQACCYGQQDVVRSIVTQLGIFWNSPATNRKGRPLTFCLVGGNGVGKTHLINNLLEIIDEVFGIAPTEPLDMNRFSTYQLANDMVGRDSSWRDGGREGELTSRASNNPRGLLVLENIDKAHQDALAYIDSMVTNGRLLDALLDKQVSFAENIVLMTCSIDYRKSSNFVRMSEKLTGSIPKDKMADLVCDSILNTPGGVTSERNVCSIMRGILSKTDAIIPMNDHDVESLACLIRNSVRGNVRTLAQSYDLKVEVDEEHLVSLFMDSLESLSSGNAVMPMVSEALSERTLQYIMGHVEDDEPSVLRIVCDELPALPGSPSTAEPYTLQWMREHTAARRRHARRLRYRVEFSRRNDVLELHFTDLTYIMLPNIEEADFFAVTVPDVKAEDLVGMELPWQLVKRALAHLHGENQRGVTPQYGILLCGPPGTGKTSFSKAIATELERPFIYLSGADLCRSHPALGVKRVKEVFAAARRTGAIIFIDEIDAIGSREASTGVYDVVINALLVELDGFNGRQVLVIAATNRPECLDPALVRNGRLHTRIYLGCLTNADDRRELISKCVAAADVCFEEGVLDFAVSCTYDWSPANVKSLLDHAIRFALDENRAISRRDIAEAMHKEHFGEETQKIPLSAEKVRSVAVHESGHALASSLLGLEWVQVTINGSGNALGYLQHSSENHECDTAAQLRNYIQVSLAGRAAEELLSTPGTGSTSDFTHARELATRLVDERLDRDDGFTGKARTVHQREHAIERVLNECMTSVRCLLSDNLQALSHVVETLIERRVLLQAEVQTILGNVSQAAYMSSPQNR